MTNFLCSYNSQSLKLLVTSLQKGGFLTYSNDLPPACYCTLKVMQDAIVRYCPGLSEPSAPQFVLWKHDNHHQHLYTFTIKPLIIYQSIYLFLSFFDLRRLCCEGIFWSICLGFFCPFALLKFLFNLLMLQS